MFATFKHGSTSAARYKKLGITVVLVSKFCLGTKIFGTSARQPLQHDEVDLITARALDAVIHLINTANGAR
ncbi:hypothetical protein ACA40_12855 [Pseudomonas syringae pv. lapsa]|nr:hypothetical protein ACA40_12855 [Pseudomonas syringae pv. lapsa]POD56884.1 hypothetical protein BKM15_01920 [Pseudomonas syringae pv. syringae]